MHKSQWNIKEEEIELGRANNIKNFFQLQQSLESQSATKDNLMKKIKTD